MDIKNTRSGHWGKDMAPASTNGVQGINNMERVSDISM
jgi:hypothetical protein